MKKLHVPEFLWTKQSANELVKWGRSPAARLGAGLWSRLREKEPAEQTIVVQRTWRSPQSNLRGLHLWVCFPPAHTQKRASEESGAACSTSPLTDSTFQGSHAAVHAHWSSLTCLTFPGPHGWLTALCPAEKATQYYAGGAIPASPYTHYHLEHGQGECFGLQRDSHSIWEALNCKTRVWPRNLAVIDDWESSLDPQVEYFVVSLLQLNFYFNLIPLRYIIKALLKNSLWKFA